MLTGLDPLAWLGILIATVVSGALGGLYFALLVPKYYAIALGRQNAEAPKPTAVSNLGPLVCTLVTVITSAVLIRSLDITTIGAAVAFGLLVGVGYLAAMTFQIAINPNFPRPLLYGVINAPFFVVTSTASSVIIALLR
ncbi:hypothetical protein J2S43_002389 [Catenuloplanes nepalensis]|uniref:DUF1761 domain-containing protein n=1 Tax=Catenuloplanes nepalensis TaxID=587533 RepID=A0ABT9MR31_9ACTN|nr:DUF1761 domain-containing protein [Catenuloplanes nepalensis]MDP9793877.1 hypothetical protein [Catenuloplanes nepalensis]